MSLFIRVVLAAVLAVLASGLPVDLVPTSRMGSYAKRKTNCLKSPKLICHVTPTKGHYARGFVKISPRWVVGRRGLHECHCRIKAEVSGLSAGRHGFHIHTYGDTRADDGASTGGHFTNPSEKEIEHGFASSKRRHMGDLNNLLARPSGKAKYLRTDNVLRLHSIIGRGITIHQESDKGPSFQPTGSAGARVGTCVIGYANPDM